MGQREIYFSKNYETILNDFNYKLVETKDSELPSSTAKKYAKINF